VVNGPRASGIAGQLYKILNDENYFGSEETASRDVPTVGPSGCCQ